MTNPHSPQLADHIRFWGKTRTAATPNILTGSPCWEWTAGKGKGSSYGYFWINGKTRRAHRVALELAKGIVFGPDDCALHRCDNRECVRPSHLYVGTDADNVRDMVGRGRHAEMMKTHCPQGHSYAEYGRRDPRRGTRHCRMCQRLARRAKYLADPEKYLELNREWRRKHREG